MPLQNVVHATIVNKTNKSFTIPFDKIKLLQAASCSSSAALTAFRMTLSQHRHRIEDPLQMNSDERFTEH